MGSRRFLILLIGAFAALFPFLVFPNYALAGFSTVDTYFEQHPDQAVGFAAQLNINTTTAGSLAATNQAVPVAAQVLDASGKVIATTYNGTTTVAAGTNPFLAIFGGGVAVGGIGATAISSLRDKANQRYSEIYPNDTGATKFRARIRNNNAGCDQYYEFSASSYSIIPHPEPFFQTYSGCGYTGITMIRAIQFDGSIANFDGGFGEPISITPIDPKTKWEDFTQARRDAAIGLLTPTDYKEALQGSGSPLAPLPEGASKIRITPPEGKSIILVKPDGTTEIISSPTDISLSPSPDIDGDGTPDDQDLDDDNDGIPDTQDSDDNNNGVPDAEEIKKDVPDIDIDDTCIECDSQFQDVENFVSYAVNKAKNKFPFDILGNWEILKTSTVALECPKYTFWGKEYQVCEIRNFFVAIKYSIWTSFIIRMIISL